MRVAVFFNLHKKLFSIRAESGPFKGRVIAHASAVGLKSCRLTVGKAGNARVRKEGRKNVHAFVRGELFYMVGDLTKTGLDMWYYHGFLSFSRGWSDMFHSLAFKAKSQGVAITYDPYLHTSFVRRDAPDLTVSKADFVYLGKGEGVFGLGV